MKTTMVVVDVYQLGMFSGSYNKDHKQLLKEKAVMTRSYVEDMMSPIPYTDEDGNRKKREAWHKTGKLFVIDDKATDEWHEKFDEKQEKMRQVENIEAAKASGVLEKALGAVVDKANEKAVELPSGDPNDKWTKPQLQLYCDENDIEHKKTLGVKKLLEIINK